MNKLHDAHVRALWQRNADVALSAAVSEKLECRVGWEDKFKWHTYVAANWKYKLEPTKAAT